MTFRRKVLLMAASVLAAAPFAVDSYATDLNSTVSVELDEQPLETALMKLSEQVHLQMLMLAGSIPTQLSRRVSGSMPLGVALDLLLKDTGLKYKIVGDRTLAIIKPTTDPGQSDKAPQASDQHADATSDSRDNAVNGDKNVVHRNSLMRLVGLFALCGTTVPVGTACAQDAVDTVKTGQNTTLEELIVSSRKQTESVMDVPESITALSATTLTDLNIQSFDDYAGMIPNLSFSVGSVGQANFTNSRGVTIRGVAGANTTSMYIDDTPIPITQGPRIVDIARIEVLKGPQGTLYGSDAIGGTIRIITNQPSLVEDESKFMALGGFTKNGGSPDAGGNFVENFVVVPNTFAVRVMGFVNHDAGYIDRVAPVTDGADTTQSYKDQGSSYQYGGSVTGLWQVTDAFSVNLKWLTQREEYTNGLPLVYRGNPGFDPTSLTITRQYNVPEWATNDWNLPALTLNYKADKWNVVGSTSYYSRNSYDSEDVSEAMHQFVGGELGYNNFGGVSGGGAERDLFFQQETRLAFNPTTNFGGILGLYYSHDESTFKSATRTVPGITGLNTTFFGTIQNDLYFKDTSDDVTMQKAIFGELSYKLGIFTGTAGVRRYWLNQPSAFTLQGFAVDLYSPLTIPSNATAQGSSPKFSLTARPTDATTVYASAAKGFRPGGAGSGAPLPQCVPQLNSLGISTADYEAGYKPDSVWTYELGAKQQFLDKRVLITGAIFQTNWTDIQQEISLSCGVTFEGNAGAARIRGGEVEVSGSVTDNFSLRAAYGYTDAVITNNAGGTTDQAVGSNLYDVPKSNASVAGIYTQPLTTKYTGFASANWAYTAGSLSTNNSSSTPEMRGSYAMLNARMGLRWGTSELFIYGNNLTDKLADYGDHIPDVNSSFLVNGVETLHVRVSVSTPRTIGLQYRKGY